MAIVWNCHYVLPTGDAHELHRVVTGMDIPLYIPAPAHDEASAKACNHIWISRTFQAEMNITVFLPDNSDPRMETQSDLVPESHSVGGIDFWLGESFNDLHHVLNHRLIGHAP